MEYLSVRDLAGLRGCSKQYIIKLIDDKKLIVESVWGVGGASGMQYRIPLANIEPKLQKKWLRKNTPKKPKANPVMEVVPIDLENLTYEERQEVYLWKSILDEWDTYREESTLSKREADELYIGYIGSKYPKMAFSVRGLYRKRQALKEEGIRGLLDLRGKQGKHKKAIPDEVFDIFEYFYLDESRKSLSLCLELTKLELKNCSAI